MHSTGAHQPFAARREQPERDVIAFSGCGWMLPYHIGVAHGLVAAGRIRQFTRFAGASGGSLIGAYLACAIDPETVLEAHLYQSEICRQEGTWWKLRRLLEHMMDETLPHNAHIKCSGRLSVAMTRLWPRPRLRPVFVSHFPERQDLINALLSSCMVPGYLDAALISRFRDWYVIDGGTWQLVPRIAGAVKVCPFQAPFPRSQGVKLDISPELTPDFPYTKRELWSLCYNPADMTTAREIHNWGLKAANVWLDTSDKGRPRCTTNAASRWPSGIPRVGTAPIPTPPQGPPAAPSANPGAGSSRPNIISHLTPK
ncbi:uncharacterized protein MONBRDRAFT_23560 [Monosiga brevicollis MX1]|uniref:PNPLA domain-containing protein n=1 Tax=Monosiga brevicollis TaxID=81824 RepID=A9UTT0_MONBE|nr:uncharacterized protein MONBRDRAFT_23560 [Monosiga brevicollis MX1]EDQ91546.1 predicted protein [Monosiga brevicollis MX1]|eukprot:XP_001743968.1 hypothetical protein [Monosiga brevicollis MX1]